MDRYPELIENLAKGHVIPFIGAGLPMSLGLPSYRQLIRELGENLNFDADIFERLGDYLSLAEYYYHQKGGLLELQRHLQKNWKRTRQEIIASPAYKAIVELGCKTIYTTNFDGHLEQAHRAMKVRYRTIRSAKDLVNLDNGKTHIFKLHGDITSPSTMVFTETSYFERMSFEHPLDIKLRGDVLGKSILFIGYSLSDINIRYLLFRLQKQWDAEPDHRIRPKSYVFLGRPNAVQEDVLRRRGIEPIIAESTDQTGALAEFLQNLRAAADSLRSPA